MSTPTIDKLTSTQQQIVHASLRGEIIVGGIAGSGKTIAAIHRAAHLCESSVKRQSEATVLFLCFNNALREAIQQQISTFPASVWSRVQVRTTHKWCAPYVGRSFPDYTVIGTDVERLSLVREAMRETRHVLGTLEVFERNPQVFLDEIRLIKGCNLHDCDKYIDRRLARASDFTSEDYAAIFVVAQTYDRMLRANLRLDFDDFAPIALSALEQTRSTGRYDYVIIDEAQDFTECQIRLARRLARQSLLLVADQAQAIYPVSQLPETLPVNSYDVVLSESFRTTTEVFNYARRLLPDAHTYALPDKHGPPPKYVAFRWSDEEAEYIASTIEELLGNNMAVGEIAVVARYRLLLAPIAQSLRARGILCYERDSRGQQQDSGVRLLSIHESKGHEFRAVFVIGLVESVLPCVRPEMDRAAGREELVLARRQLYVAMTRACERLWLTGSEGQPSRLLYEMNFLPFDSAGDSL